MSELQSVHNYYERPVFNHIQEHYLAVGLTENQLADMACIALNRIAPRYIRHDIDMSFYMSAEEYQEIQIRVTKAVKKAYKKVKKLDSLKEEQE
ncbi:late competence development ComFB family protein [Hydrogenovibrio sp. 3SP14C1]|uniref:late competence development ComFB family protein n=1 Tax=Hydrogenovibrio sp. 3SP14C1 TaxID=3038774 RepID=UPI0024167E90|nr:late competence development ComFB family protein [Hydrogenovibrio sp. 3SP14C1]MDG4811958.1 late competence development ComFB family protein [Hydrogenovibrio sp. 3SP14C1]